MRNPVIGPRLARTVGIAPELRDSLRPCDDEGERLLVPSLEPIAGICFSVRRGGGFRPASGEFDVAWNDTHHHSDHCAAGRLQRPVRRVRLWHGPFRNGPDRRHFGHTAGPGAARETIALATH